VNFRSEKLQKRVHSNKPPHVYHYTDATGVCGILENSSIWATSYLFLNDLSEGREAIDYFKIKRTNQIGSPHIASICI
jgi:hypothetical protein